MKKIFIIFLFIIFSSSFSLAKNNEKITVEEIENIFFGEIKKKWPYIYERSELTIPKESFMFHWHAGYYFVKQRPYVSKMVGRWREKTYQKRTENRGIAKCMVDSGWAIHDDYIRCNAKVIRSAFSKSEKNKKRRPGDIFYGLEAIENLVDHEWANGRDTTYVNQKFFHFIKFFYFDEGEKPVPGMVCKRRWGRYFLKSYVPPKRRARFLKRNKLYACKAFKKSYYKKIEKFKKDPSNEKILGRSLTKYIKNVKMVRGIREKTGITNYVLFGDMLNAVVADVKKNWEWDTSPDLKIRRVLLKKYSLILNGIEKKLDEDNYKSIDKDVSKLSKTYKDLNALTTTTVYKTVINIDEAVNVIFDANKLVQVSTLNAKDNEEEKLLALASINFMQSLIDSILSTIPEKYFVETKELSQDLFSESDLVELEVIIDTMMKKNKEIKSAELTKSMDIINKYINPSDVVKTLDNLGMKNIINRTFSQDTAAEIANQEIRDNLDKGALKEARKIIQDMDKNELSEITKEISDVAKEVSDVAKEVSDEVKDSESFSILDKKIGSTDITLKQLIGASRNR